MEKDFIHVAAAVGFAVAHSVSPVFQDILLTVFDYISRIAWMILDGCKRIVNE